MPKKIDVDIYKAAFNMFLSGRPCTEIAHDHGVSKSTITAFHTHLNRLLRGEIKNMRTRNIGENMLKATAECLREHPDLTCLPTPFSDPDPMPMPDPEPEQAPKSFCLSFKGLPLSPHGPLIDAKALKAHINSDLGRVFVGVTVAEALIIMVDEMPIIIPEEMP